MPVMGPELGELVVQIVRWVDDYFPGVVACEFVDVDNHVHTLIGKVPMVTTSDLGGTSIYPQPGGIRCAVLRRWKEASGRELVAVSIDYPDPMETTEGLDEFVVQSAQVTWIPRGHREPNSQGAWVWVDDE